MWLPYGKHLYEMRLIITLYTLLQWLLSGPVSRWTMEQVLEELYYSQENKGDQQGTRSRLS